MQDHNQNQSQNEDELSNLPVMSNPLAIEPADPYDLVPEPVREEMRQYCIFRCGRERFCLTVLEVEEVLEWPVVTKVPLTPRFLMGIFNLRGIIVPIVDIAFTETRPGNISPRNVVVAIIPDPSHEEGDDIRIGIAVDEVIGTYSTPEPLLVDQAPMDVPHCCGMLRHENRLALALDLKRVIESFPVPII
jgi:purine-binding chemotaxis protein CheW